MNYSIKEHKPIVLWVAEPWKRLLRVSGEITMYKTKKQCEAENMCKAVKLYNFIEEER